MQSLVQNLDLVAKRDNKALMKLCGVDGEDLTDMLGELRALNPKPATAFVADVTVPVTPDVLLFAQPGGGWQVELNTHNLPRVLANERYYTSVRGGARTKADKDYLSERWQQANWLVKALHQRATTILKVAAEIVRQQDRFFVFGVQHLRPLVLRDIASAVEMHESTVSRVTQNKYIATPRGLFELKYFFTNAIATTGGEDSVSALAVRERIKELVDGEKPNAILSDDKLAMILRLEGIDIARRTIAKYREAMRIPSSAQRRRNKTSA
jgi:RNA polymerase sigma-54 factor